MKIPSELRYTKDHEWVRVENNEVFIGITDFAQSELGDIVFVEVDTEGECLNKEEVFGTVEAVKTVSDLFMPIDAEILEFNNILEDNPEMLNEDPYGDGWIIRVKLKDDSQLQALLSSEDYKGLIS